jgi:hypothetical protein
MESKSIILTPGSEIIASKCLANQKMELMTVSKGKNFTERLVQIRFAKHCRYGKRAEYLLGVAEKSKKRFPVVCT